MKINEKNLLLIKELNDKNLPYFFVDSLRNSSLQLEKFNQNKTFYDIYYGMLLLKKRTN